MTDIKKVKDYWEGNTPQYWYTDKEPGTKGAYDDIQHYRYSVAYPYLPELVPFNDCQGKRVLEIGCGQGTDSLQFAKGGADVYGVDLTEAAVQKSREMFDAYGLSGTFQTVNAEDLSIFPDHYFDIVYSFGVIHHTPHTEQVIEEINRVLVPGGRAYVMIYAKGMNYLIKFFIFHLLFGGIFRQSFQTTIDKNTEYKRNSPLTKMYSKTEGANLFGQFDDVQVTQLHNPQFKNKLPRALANGIGRFLGDNLLITCKKA